MTQLKHPLISYSLVFIQFLIIGALLFTGPWLASLQGAIWQVAGVLLGLWALQTMHLGRFNIIPDPRPDSSLVQAGPYRLIRHPMYASILLFFIPLVIEAPSMLRWGLLGILIVDLFIKLHYEESLLKIQFSDYADYQTRSRKIIPFIY
ncbi:methyltransferase family protein [Thiosulfativibrio zosterae]|uniref:Isoprenylcysteine carboxyl methyltransferase n=1 Tax=Thiosulfativibrio zosterae TaxID=2675053 RepID=A0A6F8PPS4_9GAMM|nr:isoprenylcysteine carboxylmethyltransferase family protein [Thiosulfativibrio zosterae]BBP44044.1 isoprenylcysteine carboxyl methyltransferase [Thiosulfativibrio zosterae]